MHLEDIDQTHSTTKFYPLRKFDLDSTSILGQDFLFFFFFFSSTSLLSCFKRSFYFSSFLFIDNHLIESLPSPSQVQEIAFEQVKTADPHEKTSLRSLKRSSEYSGSTNTSSLTGDLGELSFKSTYSSKAKELRISLLAFIEASPKPLPKFERIYFNGTVHPDHKQKV